MAQHNKLGQQGEEAAISFLKAQGYTIVEHDWRSGHYDIDIVALTPDLLTLVFVEVKTRSSADNSEPWEAVNFKKIRHIAHSADHYIKLKNEEREPRFDIVSIVGTSPEHFKIEHIVDAYNPIQVL